jgi:hypothetical protein
MFMQNYGILMLGFAAALATAWSVAPVEGPTAVDTEVLKLAQGFRTPTETSVSNPAQLIAALEEPSVNAIVMLDGSYDLTDTLKISRPVSIRAQVAGMVQLNGQGNVQVLHIDTSGKVELAGLQIMRGYNEMARCGSLEPFLEHPSLATLPHPTVLELFFYRGRARVDSRIRLWCDRDEHATFLKHCGNYPRIGHVTSHARRPG